MVRKCFYVLWIIWFLVSTDITFETNICSFFELSYIYFVFFPGISRHMNVCLMIVNFSVKYVDANIGKK